MRRVAPRIVLAALLVGASGCTVLFGLDGLVETGSGADGGLSDGAPSSGMDVSSDAPADAFASEAAPDAGGGDAGFVCPGFCDDFDDRTTSALQGAWTSFQPPTSGSARITDAQAKSPPNSAFFTLPAQEAGAPTHVCWLGETLQLGAGRSVRVELDFSLAYTPAGYGTHDFSNMFSVAIDATYAGAVGFGAFSSASYAYFPFLPDGGYASQQTVHDLGDLRSPPGSWHHFRLDETFDPSAGRVAVAVDGNTVFDDTNVATVPPSPPSTVTFSIGLSSTRQTGAVAIYFDDVQMQQLP